MSESPQRIALLGASGIGRVHYRILHELGAEIPVILGSSQSSSETTASELSKEYGTTTAAACTMEDVLAYDLDGVSICTPPQHHLDQMNQCLDQKLPVFCEKPLFWNSTMDLVTVTDHLKSLQLKADGKLIVNTSNTMLMQAAVNHFNATANPDRFYFRFDTLGSNTHTDIAMDLLPHGLSVLLRLIGEEVANDFSYDVDTHHMIIDFTYGNCHVTFDFKEDPAGERYLGFSINDHHFSRIQEGTGASYKVFLQNETTQERLHIEDPFKSYLANFLMVCKGDTPTHTLDFNRDSLNLRIMAECMDTLMAEDNE